MEVHDANADDLEDHVNGNGVGGIAENWSDQQTIKVKVCIKNPWLNPFYFCYFLTKISPEIAVMKELAIKLH